MHKTLSYDSLRPHLTNLRFCGFNQLSLDSPKLFRRMHNMYMRLVFSLIILYIIQQILKVHEVRNDLDKVIDTMFVLLTYSDFIYKVIIIRFKADKIEELLTTMKGPIFNPVSEKHENLLLQRVTYARIFLRLYNGIAVSTSFLWFVTPVVVYQTEKPVEFTIWLPFDPNVSYFYYVAVYVWIQTSWLAFNNTTMDAYISFFLAQSKTQLSILRWDVEHLVETSVEEAVGLSKPFPVILQEHFKKIMVHYEAIVDFTNKFQNIFGGAIFYQFLVGGWIICTTAYKIVDVSPISLEFLSAILYIIGILMELFQFCYFGNEDNHESIMLLDSAYAMDWLRIPAKHRKDLIIFMERLKRPISPTAGYIVPLTNTTFVSVVKSSYSFYALLKSTV